MLRKKNKVRKEHSKKEFEARMYMEHQAQREIEARLRAVEVNVENMQRRRRT